MKIKGVQPEPAVFGPVNIWIFSIFFTGIIKVIIRSESDKDGTPMYIASFVKCTLSLSKVLYEPISSDP